MPGKLGKFQMVASQSWKGLTSENHLGMAFQAQPQRASDLMVQLLAYQRGPTLESSLSHFPTKEFEDDSEFYWNVIGSSRKNVPLVEARTEDYSVVQDNDDPVGENHTPFYLVFAEDWFAHGEVIWGSYNEVYPIRIVGEPVFEGTNTVYKCELISGSSKGIPADCLKTGERFSIGYALVEKDLSRKAGDVRFQTPVSMRNEWSTVRIQHKMGGNMLNKKLAFGIPVVDDNGKKSMKDMWIHYVDYEVECQFSDYKNNVLAWGVSNRDKNGEYHNFGDSGNVIKAGDGLFEQMKYGNTMYYGMNDNVMTLILEALHDLSASKLRFGDRRFLLRTGERGALLFNKAATADASGWLPLQGSAQDPSHFSKKATKFAPYTGMSVTDYQVVEWKAPNGVVVEIEVDPMYDDPVRNKILHPLGGVAMSYRFDLFYIGTMDQPNILKCAVKGNPEHRGYQWGPFRNPFTQQTNNFSASYDEDSAVLHKMAKLGVCILDPTRTMSIIPRILIG